MTSTIKVTRHAGRHTVVVEVEASQPMTGTIVVAFMERLKGAGIFDVIDVKGFCETLGEAENFVREEERKHKGD